MTDNRDHTALDLIEPKRDLMRIAEFASRVDTLFDLRRHTEPDGWDFAISQAAKTALLNAGSPMFKETFNGLVPLGGDPESTLERLYLVIFPEQSLIESIIAAERNQDRQGSLILTHHPLDMETSNRGFLDIPEGQLAALAEVGTSLYILHAPLDCNESISTSGAIVEGLALQRERTFAAYYGGDCGVIGSQSPEAFASFAERVRLLCELPGFNLDQVRFAGRDVSRIAVIAGGGDDVDFIREAESFGCDTFLAGHWWTPHRGDWCDANRAALTEAIAHSRMNFLSASHDGSELVVFRDRFVPLFTSWGLDVRLIRQADHWR